MPVSHVEIVPVTSMTRRTNVNRWLAHIIPLMDSPCLSNQAPSRTVRNAFGLSVAQLCNVRRGMPDSSATSWRLLKPMDLAWIDAEIVILATLSYWREGKRSILHTHAVNNGSLPHLLNQSSVLIMYRAYNNDTIQLRTVSRPVAKGLSAHLSDIG